MEIGDFLHFRVHTDELDLDELMKFLNEQAHIEFAVKEYGKSNREHIHACIKLKCPKQTFVDRMKKKFPVIKGNKYYGLAQLKKGYDTNARYCYKGAPNDYPDILQTVHTEEQWKAYYTAYWQEYQKLHPPVVTENLVLKAKSKPKTFMEKLNERIHDEYYPLVRNLWLHYGYKDEGGLDEHTLEYIQDYLADILLNALGKARKNIDDMIFERMYRNLYYGLLADCPKNILQSKSKEMVSKFRKNL